MSGEKTTPDGAEKAGGQNFLLRLAAKARSAKYKKYNPGQLMPIPWDSGLHSSL